jgi:hypothetical protein
MARQVSTAFWAGTSLADPVRAWCEELQGEGLILNITQGPGMADVQWLDLHIVSSDTALVAEAGARHAVSLHSVDGLTATTSTVSSTAGAPRVGVHRIVWDPRSVWTLTAQALVAWDQALQAGNGTLLVDGCGLPVELTDTPQTLIEFTDRVQEYPETIPAARRARAVNAILDAITGQLAADVLGRARALAFTEQPVATGVTETLAVLMSGLLSPSGNIRMEHADGYLREMARTAWENTRLLDSAHALEEPGTAVAVDAAADRAVHVSTPRGAGPEPHTR